MKLDEKKWSEYQDLVSSLLKKAKAKGASDAEVSLTLESGLSANVRLGKVDTVEFNQDKNLSLTFYNGKRKGSVSTTDFSATALDTLIEAAQAIAEHTEADPFAGLANKEDMAKAYPNLDLYHPWDISPELAIEKANLCEEVALKTDPRITNSEGASVSTHAGFHLYGNTHDFLGSFPTSRHGMSCTVIGQTANNMERDYDFTTARDPKDLESPEKVGKQAAQRTLARLNARKINTCQVPVLFASEIAPSLFGHFISAILGGALYRKSSFLLDFLGKKVFPDFMHIEELPHLPKGLGSVPFDNEGVATQQHDIVRNGILQSYVLASYSARKLGLKTTGNAGGVHNVKIASNDLSRSALIKKMHKGLVVTELMGHGINLVTGDYSRGAAGFWVENGEIQYPVHEITIAGNLKDMFLNLVAIGNDIEKRSNILTGSVLVHNMVVAGS